MLAGSLAKFGQDVILLGQTEVAEAIASPGAARGGSSTMPHKANQIASEMMVAAARAAGALLSALHASAVQEHERATHGWQLEWLVLPQMVALTSGSASHGVFVVRHLRVDVARMRENIGDAGNVVMAESLALALADRLPLEEAQALVKRASAELRGADEPLVAVVRRAALARGIDTGLDWDHLANPSAHPGATGDIIDRIVDEARRTIR